MSAAPDINQRVQDTGELPDPTKNAKPANEDARRKEEQKLRIYTVKELLEDSLQRATSRDPIVQCVTGVAKLDQKTGGMRPGHFWLLAADTSFGKSSFAIMGADVNMAQGKRVCIVTFEDDPTIYGDRLLVRRSGVNAQRFRDKMLRPHEHNAVADTVAKALPDPMLIDARSKSAERVCKLVAEAIEKHEIDCFYFDYLQEIHKDRPSGDRRMDLKDINGMLKHTVTTRGKTGMMLSQVTITESKKYPDKHSVRDCRDVANQAEAILIGFEPREAIVSRDGKPIADANSKCILVDKAKIGTKGAVAMDWDANTASFRVIEPEPGPYDEWDDYGEDGERYP